MLKLEAGKRYVRRDGEVTDMLVIDGELPSSDFALFDSMHSRTYFASERGKYSGDQSKDLICEFIAETYWAQEQARMIASGWVHPGINNKAGRSILVTHVYPPIPVRSFDWCALHDDTGEEGPVGWGSTQAEAIADLMEKS